MKNGLTANLRTTNIKHLILACCLALAGNLCHSSDALADSLIELGVHFGGGELIYEPFSNGQRKTMKAGELFSFSVGRLFQLSNSWETQLTFGVKSDAKYDQDIKVSWVRYPINALMFYRMSTTRVGFGATYHVAPKLKGYGLAGNIIEKYENAVGGLLELDFIRSERFLWGMRLTLIQYESRKDQHTVDGNSLGFLIIAQL